MRLKETNKDNIVVNLTLEQLKNNELLGTIMEIYEYLQSIGHDPGSVYYESTISETGELGPQYIEIYTVENPYEMKLTDKHQIEHLLKQIQGYYRLEISGGYVDEYDEGDSLIIEDDYSKKYYPNKVADISVSLEEYEDNVKYKLEIYPPIKNKVSTEYKLYNQGVKNYLNNFWGIETTIEEEVNQLSYGDLLEMFRRNLEKVNNSDLFEDIAFKPMIELDNYILNYTDEKLELVREFIGRDFRWNRVQATELTKSLEVPLRYTITDLSWRNSTVNPSGYQNNELNTVKNPNLQQVMHDELFHRIPRIRVKQFNLLLNRGITETVRYDISEGTIKYFNFDGKLVAWFRVEPLMAKGDTLESFDEDFKELDIFVNEIIEIIGIDN